MQHSMQLTWRWLWTKFAVAKCQLIRRACAYYSVPRSTLHNRVKGVHNLKAGHQTAFTEAEEKSLVHHIQVVSQWGFPFTTLDMRMVAKRMLDSAGKNIKCFKNNLPSAEWARLFLERYASELTQRSCQNTKRVRASVSPDQINQYFDNLTRSLKNTDGSEIPTNRHTMTRPIWQTTPV